MKINRNNSDDAVLRELGSRLQRTRLERNLTQVQLADEAGVGRGTVQRIEDGGSASLTSLVRVLRTLGLTENLDQLIPEPLPSPINELKREGKTRMRAGGRRTRGQQGGSSLPWRWGDEPPVERD